MRLIRSSVILVCAVAGLLAASADSRAASLRIVSGDGVTELLMGLEAGTDAVRTYPLGTDTWVVEMPASGLEGIPAVADFSSDELRRVQTLGPDVLGRDRLRLILTVERGVTLREPTVRGGEIVVQIVDEAELRRRQEKIAAAREDLREEKEESLERLRREAEREKERALREEARRLERERQQELERLEREERQRLEERRAALARQTEARIDERREELQEEMDEQLRQETASMRTRQEEKRRQAVEALREEERRRTEQALADAREEMQEEHQQLLERQRRELEQDLQRALQEMKREIEQQRERDAEELREASRAALLEEKEKLREELVQELARESERQREKALKRLRRSEEEATREALEEAREEAERRREEALRRFWKEADRELERALEEAGRQSDLRREETLDQIRRAEGQSEAPVVTASLVRGEDRPGAMPGGEGLTPEQLRARRDRLARARREQERRWQVRQRWIDAGIDTERELAVQAGRRPEDPVEVPQLAARETTTLADLLDPGRRRRDRYADRREELEARYGIPGGRVAETSPRTARVPVEEPVPEVGARKEAAEEATPRQRAERGRQLEGVSEMQASEEEARLQETGQTQVARVRPEASAADAEVKKKESPAPREEAPDSSGAESEPARASEEESDPEEEEDEARRAEERARAEALRGEPRGRLEARVRRQEQALVRAERDRMRREAQRRAKDQRGDREDASGPVVVESPEEAPSPPAVDPRERVRRLEERRASEAERTEELPGPLTGKALADTFLRSGPAFIYPRVGEIREGQQVIVEARMEDWLRTREGGWVFSAFLETEP